MTLSSALERLANYRKHNSRASQDVMRASSQLLDKKALVKLGDDLWQPMEQLALAALDTGDTDTAFKAIQLLSERFPDSPRILVLSGILLESTKGPDIALEYYRSLIKDDAVNAAAWKRIVSVLRDLGKIEAAAKELCEYLDTFYNDVEAWIELSSIYASCNRYSASLQSLSHVLLLAPQNPFYFQQFAETAYTANDIPLAFKNFVLVTEMVDRDSDVTVRTKPEGISARAWWGVKLTAQQLLNDPSSATSMSSTPLPKQKHLRALDALATERVLASYPTGVPGREFVLQRLGKR